MPEDTRMSKERGIALIIICFILIIILGCISSIWEILLLVISAAVGTVIFLLTRILD